MVVSYPSRPGIFQTDPFASFQQGHAFTKGIRNERDAVEGFGEYDDWLRNQNARPSLAALSTIAGQGGNDAFNGSSTPLPQTALAAADAVGAGTTQPIYMASVRRAESGGNDLARNPNSTATGRYQFLASTWNDLARKHPDLGLTPDGRTDPAQQERAMQVFTRENARMLAGEGIPVNPGNLYAAHFLGAGGASSVLKQPDNGLISSYLPPEVVAANPHLQGMTVADFRQWAAKQGNGPTGGYAAPQMAGIPNGGFPSPRPVEQRSVLPPRDVMMALFRSPDTRQLAISLAQAAQSGQPIEQFQTFQREDGSVWQMNTQTGEMSVLQQGQSPQKPMSINNQLVDPVSGEVLGDYRDPAKPEAPVLKTIFDPTTGREQTVQWDGQGWKPVGGVKAPSDPLVTVNTGDGAPGLGKLSTDFGYVLDPATGQPKIDPATGLPTAAPVPGSPAAIDAANAAAKAEASAGKRIVSSDVIIEAARTARDLASKPGAAGMVGAGMGFLSETDAAELRRQVGVLTASASIENLTAMRQASPTGGALGSVTERENAMLAAAAGAINPDARPDQFQRQLDNYERTLLRIVHGPEAGDRIFAETRRGAQGESKPPVVTQQEYQSLPSGSPFIAADDPSQTLRIKP